MPIVSKIRMGALLCDVPRLLVGHRQPGDVDPPPIDPDVPPPDDGLTDPYWDDVVLLVGSDSGHNVDESSRHNGDGGGVASPIAKYGPYSIDAITSPGYSGFSGSDASDPFNLHQNQMDEFTIEAWIYLTNTITDVEMILAKTFIGVSWFFSVQATELRYGYQVLESGVGGGGVFTNVLSTGANIVGGQWFYVAVDKAADKTFRLYRGQEGGVATMVGKRAPNDASCSNSWIESAIVGQAGLFGTNNFFGQIDELRVTRHARYKTDGNYPVPVGPFPRPPFPMPHGEANEAEVEA